MNRNLNNIYWIGGSPCSGKSTIVDKLNMSNNSSAIHCDDYINEHLKRINKKDYPIMHKLSTMSWDELFMRPVESQVIEEFQYYIEEFNLVLEDVENVTKRPLFIEGTGLLPESLHHNDIDISDAIFLVPTKEFQLLHYNKRKFKDFILSKCSEPKIAYENWMRRDVEYANLIESKAKKLGYRVIRVKLDTKVEELLDLITEHFKLDRS